MDGSWLIILIIFGRKILHTIYYRKGRTPGDLYEIFSQSPFQKEANPSRAPANIYVRN